ncbi:MAG TPA: SURF1 family protein [Actinomycetota bacterium]|jgi:cytochrome oxidase assembly protein ShyY1
MLARAMYRFVFERRWFAGLLLILAIATACVRLGFWQLRRLDEARETQRVAEARLRMPVEPLESITSPASAGERRVEATGRYDVGRQIVLEARSYQGRSGRHLLTPLVLADGSAVIVDRGWISESTDPSSAAPPPGQLSATGLLLPGEHPGFLTPKANLSASRVLARIDLDTITRDMPYRIYPLWLLLEKQNPPAGAFPVAAPLPPPEEPPHLSYAIQWFLFATTALVGYAFLVRREARDRRRRDEPPVFETDFENDGLETPASS